MEQKRGGGGGLYQREGRNRLCHINMLCLAVKPFLLPAASQKAVSFFYRLMGQQVREGQLSCPCRILELKFGQDLMKGVLFQSILPSATNSPIIDAVNAFVNDPIGDSVYEHRLFMTNTQMDII